MNAKIPALGLAAACFFGAPALADPVRIVAAENFYGDLATQIGGANVAVTSILNRPDADPHLFEASAATARALTEARIVIVNGVGYDPWMEKLLKAPQGARPKGDRRWRAGRPQSRRQSASVVRSGLHESRGEGARRPDLAAVDPAHEADYEQGEAKFLDSLKPLDDKIAAMRAKFAGQPITASEPVFGDQAGLIGLEVRNEKFALAVMNNAEPTVSEVAAFEDDLKGHKVKAMLYNAQASEPAVQRLVKMARDNGIPVVGVSETEPANTTYQAWMLGQLNALDRALGGPTQ